MQKIAEIKILWFAHFALLFLVAYSAIFNTHDPDFGWHLKIGQDIIKNHSAPHVEQYLFPIKGETWVDHEWLSNVIFYVLFSLSPAALAIFLCLILIATYGVATLLARKITRDKIGEKEFFGLMTLLNFSSFLVIDAFFSFRVQVFSWFLFVFLFYLSYLLIVENRRVVLYLYPLLMLLWVQLHGSFIFGLAFIVFSAFVYFATRKIFDIYVLLSLFFSFTATFINPYGIDLWRLIVFEYGDISRSFKQIVEWLPFYYFPIVWSSVYWFIFSSCFFVEFLIGNLFKQYKSKMFLASLFVVLFFFIEAILYRRMIVIYIFVCMPFLAYAIAVRFNGLLFFRKNVIFIFCLFAIILLYFSWPIKIFGVHENYFYNSRYNTYPVHAVEFLKKNEWFHDKRIFNFYSWGGYMLFIAPDLQIYIDGRMPQRIISDDRMYIEEMEMMFDKNNYISYFDKYKIDVALLPRRQKKFVSKGIEAFILKYIAGEGIEFTNKEQELVETLRKNWKVVFEFGPSIIFVRPESLVETK